jgi:hypothetical protein
VYDKNGMDDEMIMRTTDAESADIEDVYDDNGMDAESTRVML